MLSLIFTRVSCILSQFSDGISICALCTVQRGQLMNGRGKHHVQNNNGCRCFECHEGKKDGEKGRKVQPKRDAEIIRKGIKTRNTSNISPQGWLTK